MHEYVRERDYDRDDIRVFETKELVEELIKRMQNIVDADGEWGMQILDPRVEGQAYTYLQVLKLMQECDCYGFNLERF